MIQAVLATMLHFRVITFVVFVIFFCFCFAIACHVFFGSYLESFWTVDAAIFSIFTDNVDLAEMQSLSGDMFKVDSMGVGFFFLIFVFITLTLLNIFIGLTGEVYAEMYQESSSVWLKEVNNLLEEHLITGKGLLKNINKWGKERSKQIEKPRGDKGIDSSLTIHCHSVDNTLSSTCPCVCSACRKTPPTVSPENTTDDGGGAGEPVEKDSRAGELAEDIFRCNFPDLLKIAKDLTTLDVKGDNKLSLELVGLLVHRIADDTATQQAFDINPRISTFESIQELTGRLETKMEEIESKLFKIDYDNDHVTAQNAKSHP